MEPLLFLAHRLPYPPNKGDKVRSHAFLRYLAGRYRVFLGAFVDQPEDRVHVAALEGLCAGVHVELIRPAWNRIASLRGLFSGEPLSLPYFRSARLAVWTRNVVRRHRIRRALVFSSPMAQYVIGQNALRRVVDFVDMDSEKWADYALLRGGPAAAIYGREARRLFDFERAVAAASDASLFVTAQEARRFVVRAPECAERVYAVGNGVDSSFFSPERVFARPFPAGERAVVFTGAMDYWPNIDAVVWFARGVLPELRRHDAAVRFYVVGMNPDMAVRALAGEGSTVVTGRVPDVRPYLQHAVAVVAPLRVARGVQNKVLEAMAMARPVIASSAAAQALGARAGEELYVASDAAGFVSALQAVLYAKRGDALERAARARVLCDYTWASSFERLGALLEGSQAQPKAGLG